jgi:hypothetical protein
MELKLTVFDEAEQYPDFFTVYCRAVAPDLLLRFL